MDTPKLPPEILFRVIEALGADFFRRDISRLAISKTWCAGAEPVLYGEVELKTRTCLERFVERFAGRGEVGALGRHLSSFQFHYYLFEDNASRLKSERLHLRSLMNSLSEIIQLCPRLRHLGIEARMQKRGTGFIRLMPMCDLLSSLPGHVTSLDIDSPRGLDCDSRYPRGLCTVIPVVLLPRLRRISVRLRHWCSGLFRLGPGSGESAALEEAVFSMVVEKKWEVRMLHCRYYDNVSYQIMRAMLGREARRQLVDGGRFPKLRKLRVVGHHWVKDYDDDRSASSDDDDDDDDDNDDDDKGDEFPIVSLDVISGKYMRLTRRDPWDADGPVVEMPEYTPHPEEELYDDI